MAELKAAFERWGGPRLSLDGGLAWVRIGGKQADVAALWELWQSQRGWRHFPVFAREVLPGFARLDDLPRHGRVERMIDAFAPRGLRFRSATVLAPDHPSSRPLEPLARSLSGHLSRALPEPEGAEHELVVLMIDSTTAWLCWNAGMHSAPIPAGVPRLKFPREAPSRSTLKLDEALLLLLTEQERRRWLAPGFSAVDLGAAPGGWTWQLVNRGGRVIAVDNGPMDAALMSSGKVEHRRADGFKFTPPKSVDWLVCDMVEQPLRIARLVADWLDKGWARRALINLKLPMRQRWLEVERGLALFSAHEVRCKQLYHDREEVTALILP